MSKPLARERFMQLHQQFAAKLKSDQWRTACRDPKYPMQIMSQSTRVQSVDGYTAVDHSRVTPDHTTNSERCYVRFHDTTQSYEYVCKSQNAPAGTPAYYYTSTYLESPEARYCSRR